MGFMPHPVPRPQVSNASLPAPATARREVRVALWPIIVVLYATLLPREIRLDLGGLQFFADRIGLIIALPYVLKKIADGAIRFVLPDILMLFTGIWMIVAMSVAYGIGDGLIRGGSLALDATVGYYLARISFRSLADVRRILILFVPGIFLVGCVMAVESITHARIVIPLAEGVFGKLPLYVGGDAVGFGASGTEIRMGLMRAQGPFSHPILAGLYLASLVGVYSMAGLRGWPKLLGNVAGLLCIFSVSSAAILGLILTYAMVGFDLLQRRVRELSWSLVVSVVVVAVVIVQVASDSGAAGLIGRYLTLDPSTAYYRQLIWEFAGASVRVHPLFGIGLAGYARPSWMVSESIDAHWLLLAVRYGLPAAFAQGGAVILALFALGRASLNVPLADQRLYRGVAISLATLALMMFTVTLWGGALGWFNLLLGGCVACAQRAYQPLDKLIERPRPRARVRRIRAPHMPVA
ncbi:O-antigen ligase family protein (plasmid) [Sphingomonas aurantiaca]